MTLAAYSNVYDVYGKLITDFTGKWSEDHDGQTPIFQTSFGGSTTQSQNVVNGFPADIVALSLDPDVQAIEDAGLITHDWHNDPNGSIVATSDVVFDVRPGNPKDIHDWSDLAQPGLQILTPDPAQSGGAKWNIVAAYGAATRGNVPGYKADDPADAQRLLEGIFKNVTVLDKSANDSLKNFESGNGDVAITYEYAVLAAQAAGGEDEMVTPPSTVAIQTPTVVVDKNAEQHCVKNIADAFVKYLGTPDAQAIFHDVGYERPIDVAKAQKGDGDQLEPVKDLFTTDDIGGWDRLNSDVFGDDGVFTKAFQAAKG
ncbi:MAG: sulfate ABC transporter substrate-binding protein [Actinomycetota bacterium]|nr:sulfate ABC transporter substrate-binding protein [Actinomycetota bacterium]